MQVKQRIFRRNPLNRHLGRARIAGGVSKQNDIRYKKCSNDKHVNFRLVVFLLPRAPYAYKNYWLCDRCDRDFMLKKNQQPSMTSKRSHHLIKLLMVIWRFNSKENQFTKISHAYNISHLTVD